MGEQVRGRDPGHKLIRVSECPPSVMVQRIRQRQKGFRFGRWFEFVCIVHGRTVAHEEEQRKNIFGRWLTGGGCANMAGSVARRFASTTTSAESISASTPLKWLGGRMRAGFQTVGNGCGAGPPGVSRVEGVLAAVGNHLAT